MQLDNLLTVDDVAKMLRLTPKTLRWMAELRVIRAIHVDGTWWFEPEAVRAWLGQDSPRQAWERTERKLAAGVRVVPASKCDSSRPVSTVGC